MIARSAITFALAALASASLVAYAAPGGNGNGHGPKPKPPGVAKLKPGKGRVAMTRTDLATDDAGRIETRRFPAHKKQEVREWLRFKLRKLDASASYSIWIDDPFTTGVVDYVRFGDTITTNAEGEFNVFVDTKKGDAMPFADHVPPATLADLVGMAVQVRVGDGADVVDDTVDPAIVTPAAILLTGAIPALK